MRRSLPLIPRSNAAPAMTWTPPELRSGVLGRTLDGLGDAALEHTWPHDPTPAMKPLVQMRNHLEAADFSAS